MPRTSKLVLSAQRTQMKWPNKETYSCPGDTFCSYSSGLFLQSSLHRANLCWSDFVISVWIFCWLCYGEGQRMTMGGCWLYLSQSRSNLPGSSVVSGNQPEERILQRWHSSSYIGQSGQNTSPLSALISTILQGCPYAAHFDKCVNVDHEKRQACIPYMALGGSATLRFASSNLWWQLQCSTLRLGPAPQVKAHLPTPLYTRVTERMEKVQVQQARCDYCVN